MPVVKPPSPSKNVQTRSVVFRATADTRPDIPGDEMAAYTQSIFDLLALAIAAGTGRVVFRHPRSGASAGADATRRRGLGATLLGNTNISVDVDISPRDLWRVSPPFAALQVLRTEMIRVRRISYSNPVEVDAVARLSEKEAGQVLAFLRFFNTAGAERKKAAAEADRAHMRSVVEDATIEVDVDSKFVMLEREELKNDLKNVNLAERKLALRERQFEFALRVIEAQAQMMQAGMNSGQWSEKDARRIMDNVRLIASIDISEFLDVSYSMEIDE